MSDQPIEPGNQGVTSVIRHTIKPGVEAEYEEWLKRLAVIGHRFPGHQGANIIRPAEGTHTYAIIVRFDTIEHLQNWLSSGVRQELMKEVQPLLARRVEVDVQTGLDFWFTPPASLAATKSLAPTQHVKPYKQFLIVLSAIYPLEILVHFTFDPLAQAIPLLGVPFIRDLFDAVVIVTFLTFLIMPYYTRILAKWLFD
jgi:antibiotic biosynthesis monooxygenase (ABM) superfamily enzyme